MTRVVRRTGRVILEAILGLLVGLGILLGVAVYFLSTGPVSISALNPRLEAALNQADSPVQFDISDTQLLWAGWDRAVDVVALGVTVSDKNSKPLAFLPEVSFGLSARALMEGTLELSTVEILSPSFVVSLEEGGSLALAFEGIDADKNDVDVSDETFSISIAQNDQLIPQTVLDAIVNDFREIPVLETLDRFYLLNAEFRIQDSLADETIWLHSANLTMTRLANRVQAFFSATVEDSEGATIDVTISTTADRTAGIIEAVVEADQIDPALLGRQFQSALPYLPDLPLDGTVTARFGLDGALETVLLDAKSVIGTISAEMIADGPLPSAQFNVDFQDLDVAEWLSGVQSMAEFSSYIPRVDAGGTISMRIDEAGEISEAQVELASDIGQVLVATKLLDSGEAFEFAAEIQDLRFDKAAETAPLLDAFVAVSTPVTAKINGMVATDGTPLSGSIDAKLGPGTLKAPGLLEGLPEIANASAFLSVESPTAPVTLERAELTFAEGTGVYLKGEMIRPNAEENRPGSIKAEAGLMDLSFDRIADYWPPEIGPKPRVWLLKNIPSALVPSANITVSLGIPDASYDRIDVKEIAGSIQFTDAEVHYLRPLAPAQGVAGEAQFTADRFEISVSQGQVLDAEILEASAVITGIVAEDEQIDIVAKVDAPLKTAFSLLDAEPRRYISRLGMDAGAIDGSAQAEVRFRFPLLADLKGEQVYYAADAALRNVSLPQPRFDMTVTAEQASLSLVPGSMSVAGLMTLGDIPAEVHWTENFDGEIEPAKAFQIKTKADVAALVPFGLDVTDYAFGPAALDLAYSEVSDGTQTFTLSSDLTDLHLHLEPLDWDKPSGDSSDLQLTATLLPDETLRIDRLELSGPDHLLDLSAQLANGGTDFTSARINNLDLGLNAFSGTIHRADDWFVADLTGPQLDLSPILADDEDETEEIDPDTPKISLEGEFGSLILGPEGSVRLAKLRADVVGDTIEVLTLTGTLGADKALDVRYLPTPTGGNSLSVEADDTGIALEVADITGRLRGGALSLKGERAEESAPLLGTLVLSDFTIEEAPRLAKLLEALSLTGLPAALSSEGLAFDNLTAKFGITDESLKLSDVSLVSPSIGIALSGDVDRQNDTMRLRGDIAIKDILTRTLGQLPVLDFLVGEGLIGAAFNLSGPIEDPDITVNPLSVFAPGFLRRVFSAEISPTGPTETDANRN